MANLFITALSLIFTSAIGAIWNDDNIISFDGDLGWKLYTSSFPELNTCSDIDKCQRSGIYEYYGPFNGTEKYILERHFECVNDSEVRISYKVASCAIDSLITDKGSTTPYIHYIKGDSIPINGHESLNDSNLNIAQCEIWKTQTIEQEVTSVPDACKFNVLIRNKMQSIYQYLYIYDIQIECQSVGDIYNDINDTCWDQDILQRSTHKEYCIDIEGSNDNLIDGEYRMMMNPLSREEVPILINGQFAFEKNDRFGNAFIFEDEDLNQWIISRKEGSTNANDVIAKCPITQYRQNFLNIKQDCHRLLTADNSKWINITINEGECMDHHVVIGNISQEESPMDDNESPIDNKDHNDNNKSKISQSMSKYISIIFFASISSIGLSAMIYCYYKWFCKNYKKLKEEEEQDDN